MVKKPKAVTLDVLGTSGTVDPLAQTFTLSDTGTFSKDMFSVGKDGVTNSPLSHGEISALRLDDLDLGRLLGKGASSRVYLATHRPTRRPLALKVLQDLEREQAARHSLVSEMKVVFNALSDHLVGFYDAFLHEGAVYLALEYMDAGSLLDVYENAAREGVRVPEPLLAHILFQILQGLTYLHRERHAVHRDLKPANILLNAAGFVKLSDFGAPRAILSARTSRGAQFCRAILTRGSAPQASRSSSTRRASSPSRTAARARTCRPSAPRASRTAWRPTFGRLGSSRSRARAAATRTRRRRTSTSSRTSSTARRPPTTRRCASCSRPSSTTSCTRRSPRSRARAPTSWRCSATRSYSATRAMRSCSATSPPRCRRGWREARPT